MKKYTLATVGINKTATATLWTCLRVHPQINPSINKEIVDHDLDRFLHIDLADKYISQCFKKTKRTKVLLDGTPHLATKEKYISHLKSLREIDRLVNIFTIRPPSEIAKSASIMRGKLYYKRGRYVDYILKSGVDNKRLEKFVLDQMRLSEHIEKVINNFTRENVLFIKITELNQSGYKICDFLEIERMKIIFKFLNRGKDFSAPFQFLEQYILIKEWFKNNNHIIKEEEEKQKEIIKERFGLSW
jgi:hypothetical protein